MRRQTSLESTQGYAPSIAENEALQFDSNYTHFAQHTPDFSGQGSASESNSISSSIQNIPQQQQQQPIYPNGYTQTPQWQHPGMHASLRVQQLEGVSSRSFAGIRPYGSFLTLHSFFFPLQ
jgi:hypothetical protein